MMTVFSTIVGIFWFGLVIDLSVEQKRYEDAIFVVRTKNMLAPPFHVVPLDKVIVDAHGNFEPAAYKFYASADGAFWSAISGGANIGKTMHVDIYRSDHEQFCIFHHANNTNGIDTHSRDAIVDLKKLQTLHLLSHHQELYSNNGFLTSLTIFRLTDLMKTDVFFSAGRETGVNGTENPVLQFPIVSENEGNAYDPKTGLFRVPQNGFYFVSISMGMLTHLAFDCVLRKNTSALASLVRSSTAHNGYETFSRGSMFYLQENDIIFVEIKNTSYALSGNGRETSFSAFLYDPVHGYAIAWSVTMPYSWSDSISLVPVPYNETIVNLGGHWNETKHHFVAPITGLYYLTVTAGAQAYKQVYLSVMVNLERRARLIRTSTVHNGIDLLSRSLITHVEKGEGVYVLAEGGTALYGSEKGQTSFTGFLLFPFAKPKV